MAGNNNVHRGPNRDKPFRDALRLEKAALENGQIIKHPKGSLRWNAQILLMGGTPISIREVADRLDGKVAQTIAGDDELPAVKVEVTDEQRAAAIARLVKSIKDRAKE